MNLSKILATKFSAGNFVKSKNLQLQINGNNKINSNRLGSQLAALAFLGASIVGVSSLYSCSSDDITEADTKEVQKSNVISNTLKNLSTPAERIGYITKTLGLENGINKTGEYAGCNKAEHKDGSFDEIYSQMRPASSSDAASLLTSGLIIHRNTGNMQTDNTAVQYQQRTVNGENGSILIIRKYLDDDKCLSVKKGDTEYITITPAKDGWFNYSLKNASDSVNEKLYKDEDGTIYKGDIKLTPYSYATGGRMPAAIGFSTTVDDWNNGI